MTIFSEKRARAAESRGRLFEYQLEMLKLEIDLTDKVISRMETITQSTKNWAVLIWVGAMGALLAQPGLRGFIYLAGIPSALFWFIDAWWLHLHRGAFVRQSVIAEFLNGKDLVESFEHRSIRGLKLLDPYGEGLRGTPAHKSATRVIRILFYGELVWLYGGLIALSLALQLIVNQWHDTAEFCVVPRILQALQH